MPLSDLGHTPAEHPPLADRGIGGLWARLRNALFASGAFQRFCVRFPLTQATSNAYARRLCDLAVGFSYARVLHACASVGLFEKLARGPLRTEAIATACALPVAGARILLHAAAALDLVEACRPDAYRLGPLGAALLGNPGVEAMIAHHSLLYRDLSDPIALLRGEQVGGEVARFWPYAETADAEAVTAYSNLMAKTQAMIARLVVSAYDFRRHRYLLDVGGGEGVFVTHAARAAPALRACVVDLAPVAQRARAGLAAAGLGDRITAIGADARTGPLPAGADVISFVRVLHDHDDGDAMAMLRTARAALAPSGRVIIAEPMADRGEGAGPMGAAYFGLYLAAMGQGRPRTAAELQAMARDAGFRRCVAVRTAQPVLARLLVAQVG
jgi:demethylspheroidene O-methyltransferase